MLPAGSSGSPVVRNACSTSGENRSLRAHTSRCLAYAQTLVCGSGERTPTADVRRRSTPQRSRRAPLPGRSVRAAQRAFRRSLTDPIPGEEQPMANDASTFGIWVHAGKTVILVLFSLNAIVMACPWRLLLSRGFWWLVRWCSHDLLASALEVERGGIWTWFAPRIRCTCEHW